MQTDYSITNEDVWEKIAKSKVENRVDVDHLSLEITIDNDDEFC